jgi:phage-related protein/DNA-binding XRE family transcriptional regulator
MATRDRPLAWLAGEIKTPPFSAEARIEAGFLLRQLQQGTKLSMPHSRPMPSIGSACHELRVQDRGLSWRIIYRIDSDAIVILEVFEKKTRATPRHIIDICRERLRRYDAAVKERGMKRIKKDRLKARGWKLGSTGDFLGLQPAEAALIEVKLALSRRLKDRRTARHLSQEQLAQMLRSSQSRVAKMEAGDPTVSVDLLLRSLFALGATPG